MKIHCSSDKVVPISQLKLNPKNRNVHPKEQIQRLAEILKYQGWRYPVKISKRSGIVTSGHGRIEAALLNGWDEVPVDFQDYESDEQEYADTVSDNAIASWAELDLSGIQTDVKGLSTDFKTELLGTKFSFFDSQIEEINHGDENSEWVGDMPQFKEGDNYIKLTYIFGSVAARDSFILDNQVKVDLKRNDNNWICHK